MKKIISLSVTACLLISLCLLTASAAGFPLAAVSGDKGVVSGAVKIAGSEATLLAFDPDGALHTVMQAQSTITGDYDFTFKLTQYGTYTIYVGYEGKGGAPDKLTLDYKPPAPKYDILITKVTNGNGQANVDFAIASANGKGYTVYLSKTGVEGPFTKYGDVNYNSKGAHVKGLTNGTVYFVYIEYTDAKNVVTRSEAVELRPSK